MPVMDGKETLKLIRQIPGYQDVPVLLFTTSNLTSDQQFAQRNNAGFISKPLNFKQMDLVVDQILKHCSDDVKSLISKFM
jgi:CheY-like chemotaxis protein